MYHAAATLYQLLQLIAEILPWEGPRLIISLKDVMRAKRTISPHIHHTPLLHSSTFSKRCGADFYLKCENLQKTGSFKVRGALNNLLNMDPEQRRRGVTTCSSGNHALGVAYAAQLFDVPCVVFMQAWASPAKVAACRAYGAEVRLVDGDSLDTLNEAQRLSQQQGYAFVHPFDSAYTIAGQGTVGLEILEDLLDVEAVVVPVSGGGLLGGVSLALKELCPEIKVFGVQAENLAAMRAALDQGQVVTIEPRATCCDGLTAVRAGENTFELVQHYVDDVITLSEEEIKEAVITTLEYTKLLIEPSSATAVAAILGNKIPVKGRVVAVLTGGNCSVHLLGEFAKEVKAVV